MKVTYHAWISEIIGVSSEEIQIDKETFISDILSTIIERSIKNKNVFERLDKIYIARNDTLIDKNNLKKIAVSNDDTVSFFPAISGG
ncbi:MAG: MoaD/ThiS family protein [Alphaproteobacteria bacterium]|nr:MoaD/ThiS family protein [Alphaproteobacteria bacterium]